MRGAAAVAAAVASVLLLFCRPAVPASSRDITSRQSDTLEIFPNTLREASEGVPLTAGALPPSPKVSFGNAPTITDPALSDYTYTTKNFITVYNESTQPTYNHIEYTTISSMPKRSLFLSGSAVVYPYVTEYEGDEDSDYGKTVYRYTNELNELLPSQGSTYRLYSDDRLLRDNAWKSGMLLSRHVYRKTGGGYTEVRFDFSENTSSSSRSYPSVFIFDSSGSQVQFVQEGRSPQLDGISWISGRRFTSEEGRTWMTDIAYYDGLGRPEQTVEKWSTPDYGDIVTLREYDAAGRETILWNATEVGSDGLRKTPPAIRSSAIAEYGDDNPYTETVYENSAMDRVSSQWLQGEANRDAGASTEVEYGSSAADEILYGTVSDDGTLALRNTVPAGAFHKTVTTDPDGHRVAEYTDSEGRTVLQRSGTGPDEADTYYFYDLRGHLRIVMSPEGSSLLEAGSAYTASSDVMRRYAYTYCYDSRGRAVERRLPGRETEYYVYDAGDNAVGYQDGNLREDGQWMISGYDAFHREVWSGTVEESRSRASLQALSDSGGGLETLKGGSTFAMYSEREYDRKKSGQSSSLNYSSPASDWSYPDESRLKGYLTYERLAVLGEEGVPTGDYAERSYYYDRRGRAQQMVETNPAGVGSRLSWRYDFAGNVTEEYEQSGGVIMQTDYSYDSRGRLSGEQVRISSETVESVYGYDSRGMVNEVSRTAGDHTHTESMGYTVQGWQSGIESTPFSMDLSYWAPVISGVSPSYGGNITGMELRYGQTGSATSVGFSYDSRSRLTRSVWSGSGKYTEEGITYDLNGNLMTLKRYGDGSLIDNLSYSYTGDQIQSVSGGAGTYGYDSNGNMTGDGYHGLTLEYNTLGKVSRVKSGALTKVSYTYLADGTKVSALDASGNGLLYSGAMVFRKDGSVRSAESVGYSGGRFVADASGVLRPQIHVVDHLGSVRAIVDKSGNTVERDSYYPYGERWNDGSVEQADNRYRYNGKESQSDFGLPYLDYGARLYDPATGRWLTQDPMAEKYYGISPYAFCAGNPMRYVDADGMRIFPKGQEELDMIRNTLPIADREYVNIDKNGYIDATLINKLNLVMCYYTLMECHINMVIRRLILLYMEKQV